MQNPDVSSWRCRTTVTSAATFVFFLAVAAASSETLGQTESRTRPNIVFIMSDDHTTQAIGAYASRLARLDPTPVLDRLATDGTLFTNVFATNAICTPSRATILTGQHSQLNGVLDLSGSLSEERQYLPRLLSDAGYETALIGKWHLQAEPAAFDYYKVMPGQGSYFDPGFLIRGEKSWPENSVSYKGYSSDVITDQALEWLRTRNQRTPFLLMLHFKAPHDMFEYAPRYESYLADTEIPEPASLYAQPYVGSTATRGLGTSVSKRDPSRNMGLWMEIDQNASDLEYTHLAYQEYLKRYLRTAKGIDDNIGRLIEVLRELSLYDDTVVIYTSDQGLLLGEHDLIDKRWMYDDAMRMPLIVRHPHKAAQPERSDLLIDNTDFAPFILDLADIPTPDYMHGRSFASILDGVAPQNWRTAVYYRFWMHRAYHNVPAHFGVRTTRYKLIFFYGADFKSRPPCSQNVVYQAGVQRNEYYDCADVRPGEDVSRASIPTTPGWEFYDLENDPEELHNRYGDPGYSETIAELKRQLVELRIELDETDERYRHIQEIIDANWD